VKKAMRWGLIGAVAVMIAGAMPAASANEDDVIRQGSCSRRSDWKLKLSPENGRIEVEFEVDQNRRGRRWRVRMWHDGNRFFKGRRVTQPPSGSFEIRRVEPNRAGVDRFRARAFNPRSGETCVGRARF
jgi:hypothetical protein